MKTLSIIFTLFMLNIQITYQSPSPCGSNSPFGFANSCCSGALSISNSVTSITDYAYSGCLSITSLTVATTITSIGFASFQSCSSLSKVLLISGLRVIGEQMFNMGNGQTLLTEITIPSTLTTIGNACFLTCSALTKIMLTTGLTYLSIEMFLNLGPFVLTSVTIPSTVTFIGELAFLYSSSLSVTYLSANCPTLQGPLSIPTIILSLAPLNYINCGTINAVTVPSTLTFIGSNQFQRCSVLSQINLINGLTIIGALMFAMDGTNTVIKTLIIPSTVTFIGSSAFRQCSALSQINLIAGLITIGDHFISMWTGGSAGPSSLKEMTLPSSLTTIGSYAIEQILVLTQVVLSSGLAIVGDYMFKFDTALLQILIPSTITSIGMFAFKDCYSISKLTFTIGISIIGVSMFDMGLGPTTLALVTIPSTVTIIGSQAFSYNTALICVYWIGSIIYSPTDIFLSSPSSKLCYFPSQSPSFYPSGPSLRPTYVPSYSPTLGPTINPTISPTAPTTSPTIPPSGEPTFKPTIFRTLLPTGNPSQVPSVDPTSVPSFVPTYFPTSSPTVLPSSISPSGFPSKLPSVEPTFKPTIFRTLLPTGNPSQVPSVHPTSVPSFVPTYFPTSSPTGFTSEIPSNRPTFNPSNSPSVQQTIKPTIFPTFTPTSFIPTGYPSPIPSVERTSLPTTTTTIIPSKSPTLNPSSAPTVPTIFPSDSPNFIPTKLPIRMPSYSLSSIPTCEQYQNKQFPYSIETNVASISPSKEPFSSDKTIQTSVIPSLESVSDLANSTVITISVVSGIIILLLFFAFIARYYYLYMKSNQVVPEKFYNELAKIRWNDLIVDKTRSNFIGKGSFSTVIKAKWKNGRELHDVAVKVFNNSNDFNKEVTDEYENICKVAMKEAEVCYQIYEDMANKDFITIVYGVVQGPLTSELSTFFRQQNKIKKVGIVMRLEAGGSLDSLLYPATGLKPILSMETKVRILRDISHGILNLHSVGGIHGDIKPQNILLSDNVDLQIRLADFGLSEIRELQAENTEHDSSLRETKHFKGTKVYCAPEMLDNPFFDTQHLAKASRKTDIYAFGILIWEVLSEQKPFKECGNKEVMLSKMVHKGERPSEDDLPFDTPPFLRGLMRVCWNTNRQKRPTATNCYITLINTYNTLSSKEYDIFFSHAWVDKPILCHVCLFLTSRGYRVWYDQNDMGFDLLQSMADGIKNSKVFLCCINSTYQNSKNCMFELREAVNNNSDKPRISIILQNIHNNSWQVSDELKSSLDFTGKKYCNISKLAMNPAWREKDVNDELKEPTNEMLSQLKRELLLLEKILDDVKCFPSMQKFNW